MAFLLTADDLGATSAINEGILQAHKAGTIQAASLMMGEDHTQEAVCLAKANPSLQVGLHLVVVDGKSVLPYSEIPDLIDFSRNFPRDPAYTWFKYFLNRKLRVQLEKEIRAQFEAFRLTGLALSHVDGHHHQHLHPSIYKLVIELAQSHGARWIRVTRENLRIWRHCTTRPTFLKRVLGLIYYALSRGKNNILKQRGFHAFDWVFCFLDTFSISREYLLKLLEMNPPGIHELYFHPGADWSHDLELLLDPQVRDALLERRISLEQLGK